jgi:hypothetical protein
MREYARAASWAGGASFGFNLARERRLAGNHFGTIVARSWPGCCPKSACSGGFDPSETVRARSREVIQTRAPGEDEAYCGTWGSNAAKRARTALLAEAINGAALRSGDALASVRISKWRSPKLAVPNPESSGDPVKATELNGDIECAFRLPSRVSHSSHCTDPSTQSLFEPVNRYRL